MNSVSQGSITADQAMSFIRERGVVLASAKGPVPKLAGAIAGEPIRGSWWAHPKSHAIFAVFQAVEKSPDILICRIVKGKITFVHRRLWPALIRMADRFPPEQLAQVHQEHSQAGHHVNRPIAFPDWVPPDVSVAAAGLSEEQALAALGDWVPPHPEVKAAASPR